MSSSSTARLAACSLDMSWCERTISATCEPILCVGLRADSGSWKIIAMRLPRARWTSLRFSPISSWPRILTDPSMLRRLRQQTHRGQERHRLARPALADDAEQLAVVHRHVDTAHGLHVAGLGRERDVQVADLENDRSVGDVVVASERRSARGSGRRR